MIAFAAAHSKVHHHLVHLTLPLWQRLLLCAMAVLAAWAVSRVVSIGTEKLLSWNDRRSEEGSDDERKAAADVKRRQTVAALVRATIAYGAAIAAIVYSVSQFTGGIDRFSAYAGASLTAVLIGFTSTKMLGDVISGIFMQMERWYAIGDTIIIPPSNLQGVVEDLSFRKTTLRAINGEIIHIHNSAITSVRVLPRGVKELSVEVFVTDEQAGRKLIEEMAALLPVGPTMIADPPAIESVSEYGSLVQITTRSKVTPGREWLIEEMFCNLLAERAEEGLLVHEPVVLAVDAQAAKTFARAHRANKARNLRKPQ